MGKVTSFRDLRVYQKLKALHLEVHRESLAFSRFEMYELGSQVRRSSNSAPAQVAEGWGSRHTNMYIEAINRALGEVRETQHHLDTAREKGYLTRERFDELDDGYDHCGRMLERLHQALSEWRGSTRTGHMIREEPTQYLVGADVGWAQAVDITLQTTAGPSEPNTDNRTPTTENSTMRQNSIPGTDLRVSPICLGTMTFGTPVAETDAVRLVHHAHDRGVNFIDTANMYEGYTRTIGSPGGVAEQILGKAIAGRRGDFVVATKVGMKVGEAPEDENTSPAAIRKHLELSLGRLGIDCVDIYYLHKPDPDTPPADILGALDEVIRAGKARHYGVSNYSAEQLAALLATADGGGLPRPVIVQPGMSLLKQDVCADLLPLCAREQIVVAPYQVLQGGLLTGKYRRGQPVPADSRKAEKDGWVWELDDKLFDRIEEIEAEAARLDLSITQYAIRWTLEQPAVVSAIVGVKRPEQIDDAVAAAEKE